MHLPGFLMWEALFQGLQDFSNSLNDLLEKNKSSISDTFFEDAVTEEVWQEVPIILEPHQPLALLTAEHTQAQTEL